jgi:epoxyqueuosine reductase
MMTRYARTVDESALKAELRARATALGFARRGVARAERLDVEGERLDAWLAAGRHGQMDWMERTAELRIDPRHPGLLGSARSIAVLVAPYAREEARVGPAPLRVARYARGRDYHKVLHKRLKKLSAWLRAEGHEVRASVDSMPVFERAWAQRAGVGFIGKNACLIVPGLGSHVFLATLVTSADLAPDAPIAERCGACRLCLDACPTGAFRGPRELDARRCISYLTIEHEGDIDESLRLGMGDWVFGCDVCQDVCPFNRTTPPAESATAPFAAHPRFDVDASGILAMSDEDYSVWSEGSPLRRAGRERLARNVAVALGNAGERIHLPVLREAGRAAGSRVVRDAAEWAVQKISDRSPDPGGGRGSDGPLGDPKR